MVKSFIQRLRMFFMFGQTSSTYLQQRKSSIVSTFTNMIGELENLQKEQDEYSNQINKKIKDLNTELDIVNAEGKSIKQMVTKIKNLID